MKIKVGMESEFYGFCEKNSHDGYSLGVVRYMNRWADAMERLVEEGKSIFEIADKTSSEADIDGITGFMYGCAVSALSKYWEYGEDLRKWHNKEYNYSGDGVVNPAFIAVG